MSRRHIGYFAALAALALVVSACRGSAGDDIARGPGVTEDPCPNAVNASNGCIYLGFVTDFSGPFARQAVPSVEAQQAFWQRVNEKGGIGGYDIDATTYTRDSKYDPETHLHAYHEIKDDILALAQSGGSSTTAAALGDMRSSNLLAVGVGWPSGWTFEDVILQSGSNHCYETMNLVDYAVDEFDVESVMAVRYRGDAAEDAAAGAEMVADKRGLSFTDVVTEPGQDNQDGAIDQIISGQPDAVVLAASPTDTAVIVGQAVARGYEGRFLGVMYSWHPAILDSPAAPAFKKSYVASSFWAPFDADTPGHQAMRKALGGAEPAEVSIWGWVTSYRLKAALEVAAEAGNLNREGLLEAANSLTTVDYEGILPAEAGDFTGPAFPQTVIVGVDEDAPTGIRLIEDFFAGPTAQGNPIDRPCY